MAKRKRSTRNAEVDDLSQEQSGAAKTKRRPPAAKTTVPRTRKAISSEFRAYTFIDKELKQLGWDTRNPAKHPDGQVYSQNECLSHPQIKAALGLDRPENVIMVTETVVWVIEAKPERGQLATATKEAKDYADKINAGGALSAAFVSGVAGDEEDGYIVDTQHWNGTAYVPITSNGKPITSLLASEVARIVLASGPDIKDVPIDEQLFLTKAERINEYLHLGGINKNARARVMAALLLALSEETQPNLDAPPSTLIEEINIRAKRVLKREGKPEFSSYVTIALPPTEDNHTKFKTALVRTVQELRNLNIRSAMNSGADVLGKFYEVFLKYGNGAKEIGIVLTPRHVTKFAVDVLGVDAADVVYDPTCGTAGFLVAAFDVVKQNYPEAALTRFKQGNLFGVDREAEVVALALVNMIFRGDGKSHITEGDAFKKNIVRRLDSGKVEYSAEPPTAEQTAVTRVLMNPPFALKTTDEKEYKFVDLALRQMQAGGLLFCVLPYSAMVKPGGYLTWRRDKLLLGHTLLSVITFPEDLFYPVGVHTVGIIVRQGTPHPHAQPVLWMRAMTDGFVKSKGKRLPRAGAPNALADAKHLIQAFVANPSHPVPNVERLQKAAPIDFSDTLLELVPENYLDQRPPDNADIEAGMEQVIRDAVAFMIQSGHEPSEPSADGEAAVARAGGLAAGNEGA